jgi:hypothetical protein
LKDNNDTLPNSIKAINLHQWNKKNCAQEVHLCTFLCEICTFESNCVHNTLQALFLKHRFLVEDHVLDLPNTKWDESGQRNKKWVWTCTYGMGGQYLGSRRFQNL